MKDIFDGTISFSAIGLYQTMSSLPDGETRTLTEMSNMSKNGRWSTRRALQELLDASLVEKKRVPRTDGMPSKLVWHFKKEGE